MADPRSLEQVGDYDDDPSDDLTEFARSRAQRGEPMSPETAKHTADWAGMSPARRAMSLEMLRHVDENAAKEAKGYLQVGYFDKPGEPTGGGNSVSQDPKRQQQGRGEKPQEPGPNYIQVAKELLKKNMGAVAGAALAPVAGVVPGIHGAVAGYAAREAVRNSGLEANADRTAKDAAARKGGTMEAPTGTGGGTVNSDLMVTDSGAGPAGPQVISPGIDTLHSSSHQTQRIDEDKDAKFLRRTAMGLELDAATQQSEANKTAATAMEGIARDRQATNDRLAEIDRDRAANEEKVRQDRQRRIADAEKAFEEAEPDPKWNPYQEVANGSWDKGVMLGLGSMLGSLGAVGTGGPNQFLEQFNAQIARRVEAMRDLRKHRAQNVENKKNGYERAMAALGDQRAVDAMLEARMWKGLDARVEQIAAQLGIDSEDPRLQQVRAGIMLKHRELNLQTAKRITDVSASQQVHRPIVVVGGGGGGGKDPLEEGLGVVAEERRKRGIPEIEGALDVMNFAIKRFKMDPSTMNQLSVWLASGQTGEVVRHLAPFLASDPQAVQAWSHAITQYRQAKAGKTLTPSESAAIQREVSTASPQALAQMYVNIATDRAALEGEVQAGFPKYYRAFQHNREVARNTSDYKPTQVVPAGGAPSNQ